MKNTATPQKDSDSESDIPPGHFEVEKILDKKKDGRKIFYLIKWLGFSDSENTWEPVSNLKNIRNMIKEFEINHQISGKTAEESVNSTNL